MSVDPAGREPQLQMTENLNWEGQRSEGQNAIGMVLY